VSQDRTARDHGLAARFTAAFVKELRKRGPTPGVVYSINIPAESSERIKGVIAARMGGSYTTVSHFEKGATADGDTVYQARKHASSPPAPGDTDTHAYQRGYITIAPLSFDWTDEKALKELSSWELTTP
jgi:5'/3'-nucleotidase SurE